MEEKIEIIELEKSLIQLKNDREKIQNTLENVTQLIRENINSGIGVWDCEKASLYRERWEAIMEDFPNIIQILNAQESNLDIFIQNMKKIAEE